MQLIDLYWTVIPVLMLHYYRNHPAAESGGWRSRVAVVLTWVWFVRMSHNYFRREKWRWGEREDWRINDMRRLYGEKFWWVSFFTVYVSQQVISVVTYRSILLYMFLEYKCVYNII